MSVDKLVDSTQLDADLASVADAIRTKGGTSASLAFPAGFVQAIGDIPTGGGGAQVATGTFTGSNEHTVTIQCPFEPDLVYIVRSDIDSISAIAEMSVGQTAIARDAFVFYNRVVASGTATSGHNITTAIGTVSTTRESHNYFTYQDGTITYKCYQGNVSYFRSALTYKYLCVKWTT